MARSTFTLVRSLVANPDRRPGDPGSPFLETADEAGFWLDSNPDSDVATVEPLDQRGEHGLERVFSVLAGADGVSPVYPVPDVEGRLVRLEIEFDHAAV